MSPWRHMTIGLALAALFLPAACGTKPLSTRATEERFLGQGYANRMYNYGEQLYLQGRFPEAHAAFLAAEQNAYTYSLRDSARGRRIYLERVTAALERGAPIPPWPSERQSSSDRPTAPVGAQAQPRLDPGIPPLPMPPPAAGAPAASLAGRTSWEVDRAGQPLSGDQETMVGRGVPPLPASARLITPPASDRP